jgi:hypothetical protein
MDLECFKTGSPEDYFNLRERILHDTEENTILVSF